MTNTASLTFMQNFKTYFHLTKPRVWWLLVFTGLGGLVAASNGLPNPLTTLLTLATITLGSAGAETVANYLDRDIDSVMRRTMQRPLPKGTIRPAWKALIFGLVLVASSLVLASLINPLTLLFMSVGIFDYVVVYVMYSKRRTPLNILLGGFAGGAPSMAGYVAVSNQATLEAWIIAALVVLWIPSHVWSLALKYRDDYMRANVPMLPVVTSESKAIRCIASTAVLMVLFSLSLHFLNPTKYGLVYPVTAIATGLVLTYLSVSLITRPRASEAWRLFKFTSIHLALLFSAIIIDAIY